MAGNLKLQVVLDAIDRATGPLKKITQGSQGAGQALRETRERLRTLENAQKDLKGFANLKRSSQATAAAMSDQQRKIDELTRQIDSSTGATKRLTQSRNKAIRQAQKLKNQYGKEQTELRRLRERMARLGERFGNAGRAVSQFARRVTIATTVAGGGIFALAKSTADLGDNVAKTADKIGIGIEPLQKLRFAAERSGVSTEKLDSSLERFVKRTGEATMGTGAARKAFDELGLSSAKMASLSPEAALGQVADRLSQVDNQTRRVALASKLFGREGVAMINMLKEGSAGLDRMGEVAEKSGIILNEKTARAAEGFTDRLQTTTNIIGGMKNALGSALMPVVNRVMGRFNAWALSNRDAIDRFAKRMASGLEEALPNLLEIAKNLGNTLGLLGSATSTLARLVGGFDNLGIIFGAFLALKPVIAIASLIKGLWGAGVAMKGLLLTLPGVATGFGAVGTAIAATPIGWIIAGVAAVAGVAFLLIKNWDAVGEFFNNLWPNMKAAFSGGMSAIDTTISAWSPLALFRAGFDSVIKFFSVDLPRRFTEFGGELIRGFTNGVSRGFGAIGAVFGGIWDRIKEAFSGGIAGVGKLILDWSPMGLFFKAFSGVLGFFGIDLPGRFTEFGGQILNGFVDGILGGLGKAKDAVLGAGDAVIGWFKGKLGINSPSRVFSQFGSDTLEGYRQGLERAERGPIRQVDSLVKRLSRTGAGVALGGAMTLSAAAQSVGGLGAPGQGALQLDTRPPLPAVQGGGVHIEKGAVEIHVQAAPGMDEEALAQMVGRQVEQALTQAANSRAARQRSAFHDLD